MLYGKRENNSMITFTVITFLLTYCWFSHSVSKQSSLEGPQPDMRDSFGLPPGKARVSMARTRSARLYKLAQVFVVNYSPRGTKCLLKAGLKVCLTI